MNDTDILKFSHYLQPLFILLRFFSLSVCCAEMFFKWSVNPVIAK